jgi:molybdopterin-guanine dinucleotide biosynthesis adapter protein
MKVIGVIGATALGKSGFVEDLIGVLRIEGLTVSAIKRVPDGFDIDQPGRLSYARREAGCEEVLLASDHRMVLMREYRGAGEPALDALLARMAAVDIVIAEGFKDAVLPAVEVCVPSRGRPMRWPSDPQVFAIVADEPVATSLPTFRVADVAGLTDCIVARLGLR